MSTSAPADRPIDLAPALPARTLCARGVAVGRGERLLLEDLDIDLGPGEILLLRGPNGAGKSTLLSALAGLTRPWRGTITFSGASPEARPAADIHWLGHLTAVKPRLTVIENLKFWQQMNGSAGPDAQAVLTTVGLGGLDMLDAGVLSAGQTKRLALARLLISPRPIWLLDEPTAALDTSGDALVGRLLDEHLARGGMAVVATHMDLALASPPRTLTLGAQS